MTPHNQIRPPTLAYFDESPQAWPQLLASFKNEGHSCVRVPVPWGAHESMRGVRDFAKSPRLRLEKLLNHLHALEMKAELVFGFPPGAETFPAWTQAECEKTLLPAGLWDGVSSGYAQASVPSLRDEALRTGFLEFIDEALALICLYQGGHGPVSGVILDEGIYASDLPSTEDPLFHTVFALRYEKVEKLNDRYQASFRTFASALTKQGFRSLCEKRGWLAALDYKWCREHALREFRRELLMRPSVISLEKPPTFELSRGTPAPAAGGWEILFDSVLVESVNGKVVAPFNPGGQLNHTGVLPYRLATYLEGRAERDGVSFRFLPLFEAGEESATNSVAIVIAGKFLTRAARREIDRIATAGGAVLFPFGLPQYDEEMGFLTLPSPREKTKVPGYEGNLLSVKVGRGHFLVPQPAFEVSDALWDKVSHLGSMMSRQSP